MPKSQSMASGDLTITPAASGLSGPDAMETCANFSRCWLLWPQQHFDPQGSVTCEPIQKRAKQMADGESVVIP
jgi:hypothetical protein